MTYTFSFLKEAFERKNRLIDTIALLKGYLAETRAELGDLADRSFRPVEFELLIAGETKNPGSVHIEDIKRAIAFGPANDARSPPETNQSRTHYVPLSVRVTTMTLDQLKAQLSETERFHKFTFTDEFGVSSMRAGCTAADVLASREDAYQELLTVRTELNSRPAEAINVIQFRRAA